MHTCSKVRFSCYKVHTFIVIVCSILYDFMALINMSISCLFSSGRSSKDRKAHGGKVLPTNFTLDSTRDSSTYHIEEQRRLRRGCANVLTDQSLRCLHTESMDVNKDSDPLDISA